MKRPAFVPSVSNAESLARRGGGGHPRVGRRRLSAEREAPGGSVGLGDVERERIGLPVERRDVDDLRRADAR